MKTEFQKKTVSFLSRYLANRLARELKCPIYDGVGPIEPSDSPYVVVKAPGRAAALTVPREMVEGGIPDDIEAQWEKEMMML